MTTRIWGSSIWVACCLFTGGMPSAVSGATLKVADLTPEAVAAAINEAKDGDTVELPAGKAAWTKGWNFGRWAAMKAITIQGAGIDKTIIVDRRPKMVAGDSLFWMKGVEGKPFRLTGITMDGTGLVKDSPGVMVAVSGNCKNFRVDHCKFKNTRMMIHIIGDTYGLIDHCTFEAMEAKDGLVQTIYQIGPGLANYAKPLSLGSAEALYFEDNDVLFSPDVVDPIGNNPWIAPWGGARIVIRHNKIVNSQLEIYRHMSSEVPGSQSAEIYNNTFMAVGVKQGKPLGFIFIGGGVNIVFNNTVTTGTGYSTRTIALRNERAVRDFPGFPQSDLGTNPMDGNRIPAGRPGAGYPHFGQVGWATKVDGKFALTPCYAWDNTINGKPLRMEVDPRGAKETELATLKEGREFYNKKPPAKYYTPYVYPHPLQQSAKQ